MRVSVDKQHGEETGSLAGGKAGELEHMSQSWPDPDRLRSDSAQFHHMTQVATHLDRDLFLQLKYKEAKRDKAKEAKKNKQKNRDFKTLSHASCTPKLLL